MSLHEHIETFDGLRVRDFDPATGLEEPSRHAWRLAIRDELAPGWIETIGCLGFIPGLFVAWWVYHATGKFFVALSALVGLVIVPLVLASYLGKWWRKYVWQRKCHYCNARLAEPGHCQQCGKDWRPLLQRQPEARQDATLRQLLDSGPAGERLAELIASPGAEEIRALVVADAEIMYIQASRDPADARDPVADALALAAARLPRLEALFLGELTHDECQISWNCHGDLAPALLALGHLSHLRIRGDFSLSQARHAGLRTLIVESGGLDSETLRQIVQGDFPALEFLELWLGDPTYGGDATLDDLRPLFDEVRFPRLRHLGLRNSELTDQLASALARSPLIDQLQELDLSLGTLSDIGAEALLASPSVGQLQRLDIHFHYVSPECVQRLEALDVELDASAPQQTETDKKTGEEFRYCAVGE